MVDDEGRPSVPAGVGATTFTPGGSTMTKTALAAEDGPPQHDVAAEQAVLGGMLLTTDAITDAAKVLTGQDFYRPAHELVFNAIVELYGRRERTDPVTVAAELTRRGQIKQAGGVPYLHTLIVSVPVAVNTAWYAGVVRQHASLRRGPQPPVSRQQAD